MNGRILATVLMASLSLSAFAESLNAYIQARRDNGITAPITNSELDSFVGERVIEVSGIVKGNVQKGDTFLLILERTEGAEIYISTPQVPAFLRSGNVAARLLIRAKRSAPNALLDAELIRSVSEKPLADWESKKAQEAASRQAPTPVQRTTSTQSSPRRGSTTSRGGGRPSETLSNQPSLEGAIGNRGSSGARRIEPTEAPQANPRPISGDEVMVAPRRVSDKLPADVQAVVPLYADFIRQSNSRISRDQSIDIAETIIRWSLHFGLDARLVMAVALTESTFDHRTRSRSGAMGLLQLMPGTARHLGVENAWDLEQNVYGGVKYLREQLDYFIAREGQERGFILAIAAYNAGPGAVRRFNGVPPYRETINYVDRVTRRYRALTGG